MTLIDEIEGVVWSDIEADAFAVIVAGEVRPGVRAEVSEGIVLAAAAFVIASRAATYADLVRLHAEFFDIAAALRAFHGIKAIPRMQRLDGGADA